MRRRAFQARDNRAGLNQPRAEIWVLLEGRLMILAASFWEERRYGDIWKTEGIIPAVQEMGCLGRNRCEDRYQPRERTVLNRRAKCLMDVQAQAKSDKRRDGFASSASFSARFPNESACIAHLETATGEHFCRSAPALLREVPHLSASLLSTRSLARSVAASKVSVVVWFHAFHLLASARFGLPAIFLERYFGLRNAEVREIICGFDECIGYIANLEPFDGTKPVQIDETLLRLEFTGGADERGVTIFGISDHERVLAWPVADRTSATLIPLIVDHVPRCSEIYTDGWLAYRRLPQLGYEHRYVRHNKREWISGSGANTFAIDSFWAYLKRMVRVGRSPTDSVQLKLVLAEASVRFSYRRKPVAFLEALLSL